MLVYLGEILLLLWQTVKSLRGGVNAKDLVEQMASLGVNSVAIALLTTSTSGAVLALYFAPFLQQYGAEGFTGAVVALAIARELGPVLDRRGGRRAGRLGDCGGTGNDGGDGADRRPARPGRQPDSVSGRTARSGRRHHGAAGVRPGRRRAGFWAATVLAATQGVLPATFLNSMKQFLVPGDFLRGILKTLVFGLIIALVGCHQGLETRGGATEVGKATTNAVVLSIVLIYLANFALTYFMFSDTVSF